MSQEFEQKLANMAKQLHSGETKELSFDRRRISTGDKSIVVAQLVSELTPLEKFEREVANIDKDKVIQLSFNAHREGSDEVVIRGVMNQETIRRSKKGYKSFKIVRNFVARKIEEWKDSYRRLGEREDGLDQIYQDEQGRNYEMIDGIPTYLDDRGFDYYLKYDRNGNEYAWIKLDDGSMGTFLDPERTIIQIGDKAYRFDGTVRLDEELDIFPRR